MIFKEIKSILEKTSGELDKALEILKEGDTLVICSVDRLPFSSPVKLIEMIENFNSQDT